MKFKQNLKDICIFIIIYFLILVPVNLVPIIAAYGYSSIIISINTILMIDSFNIYTFTTYAIVSALSAGVVSFLLKKTKTSIISSFIIIAIITSLSFILDNSLQFPLIAKIVIISTIIISTIFGSFCNKLFDSYNSFFNNIGG